jgi:hypothetical protein
MRFVTLSTTWVFDPALIMRVKLQIGVAPEGSLRCMRKRENSADDLGVGFTAFTQIE